MARGISNRSSATGLLFGMLMLILYSVEISHADDCNKEDVKWGPCNIYLETQIVKCRGYPAVAALCTHTIVANPFFPGGCDEERHTVGKHCRPEGEFVLDDQGQEVFCFFKSNVRE